jgi:hypothetical protein
MESETRSNQIQGSNPPNESTYNQEVVDTLNEMGDITETAYAYRRRLPLDRHTRVYEGEEIELREEKNPQYESQHEEQLTRAKYMVDLPNWRGELQFEGKPTDMRNS